MNKKGKIITWSIILVLIVAVIIVIVTQLANGGAKKIDRTRFQEYVENTQYFKEDGTPNNNGDKIFSIEDGKELDGYKYEEGKIVTDDEKKTQLVVIWKVNTDGYEYTGYTRNSKGNYVKAYYCFGPSPYGMESWDSPHVYEVAGIRRRYRTGQSERRKLGFDGFLGADDSYNGRCFRSDNPLVDGRSGQGDELCQVEGESFH